MSHACSVKSNSEMKECSINRSEDEVLQHGWFSLYVEGAWCLDEDRDQNSSCCIIFDKIDETSTFKDSMKRLCKRQKIKFPSDNDPIFAEYKNCVKTYMMSFEEFHDPMMANLYEERERKENTDALEALQQSIARVNREKERYSRHTHRET